MSEAKAEFEKRFGGMTPDHPCVPDVWMNGFEAGKESRDGLRKALELISGKNGIVEIWQVVDKALEADGEGKNE
jgi:hypothetical protein